MFKHPHDDYQPQHPMLLEFEPSAGVFSSQCSKPSDEAIDAWYKYYIENGGIGHKEYVKNMQEYKALKKQYGCAIYPAKKALELFQQKRKLKQLKEAKAQMGEKFKEIYGVKPMHPLLREFEASAEMKIGYYGGWGGKCKKPSDDVVIKWWKYYHMRMIYSSKSSLKDRQKQGKRDKAAFKKLKEETGCGMKQSAVDKAFKKIAEKNGGLENYEAKIRCEAKKKGTTGSNYCRKKLKEKGITLD